MTPFTLLMQGDRKLQKAECRYEPGEVIVRLATPYGAPKIQLRLRVYPKYDTYELEAFDKDGWRRLVAGGITTDGITVQDAPFEGS